MYKHLLIPKSAERIFLVEKRDISETTPKGDFWIFDNHIVMEFVYTNSGTVEGAYVYEDKKSIQKYLKLKKELLSKAQVLSSAKIKE